MTTKPGKSFPFLVAGLLTLLAAVAMTPRFTHGLDSAHAEVLVSQFATPDFSPASHNVTVSRGKFLLSKSIEIAKPDGGSIKKEYAIPLVAPGWKVGGTVYVVLKTPELTEEEFAALDPNVGIDGVLRTVWWEGLLPDEKQFFANEHELTLADDVAEIEFGADPNGDFRVGLIVVGVAFVLSFGVAFVMSRKANREATS